MNTKLMAFALLAIFAISIPSTSINKQPVYYESDWTFIDVGQEIQFSHEQGKLPAFAEVYVSPQRAIEQSSYMIPAHDYYSGCLSIQLINNTNIVVKNDCFQRELIQVHAAFYHNQ